MRVSSEQASKEGAQRDQTESQTQAKEAEALEPNTEDSDEGEIDIQQSQQPDDDDRQSYPLGSGPPRRVQSHYGYDDILHGVLD
ncbi:hypothetical protein HDV00_003926 [Rhizophlyctis rosea]|nr:hypothetical protein HDV00_003926 [Rhizophlyctis rosea]